jgi:arginine:ornithine antiporter / lysine permease
MNPAAPQTKHQISVKLLIAIVLSGMFGAGVYDLPGQFTRNSLSFSSIFLSIALVTCGVTCLSYIYGYLHVEFPDENVGLISFPAKFLGKFAGFTFGNAYYIGQVIANMASLTMLSNVTQEIWQKHSGITVPLYAIQSVWIWFVFAILCLNTKTTTRLNAILTATKVIPVIALFVWVYTTGSHQQWDANRHISNQTPFVFSGFSNNCIYVLWAFVGFESASLFSAHVANKKNIIVATTVALVVFGIILCATAIIPSFLMAGAIQKTLETPSLLHVFPSTSHIYSVLLYVLLMDCFGNFFLFQLVLPEITKRFKDIDFFNQKNSKVTNIQKPYTDILLLSMNMQIFVFVFAHYGAVFSNLVNISSAILTITYAVCAVIGAWHIYTKQKQIPLIFWIGVLASVMLVCLNSMLNLGITALVMVGLGCVYGFTVLYLRCL